MTQDITAEVLKIVADKAPTPCDNVDPRTRLVEDLGYHSLALLNLAIHLEDEFELPGVDAAATREIVTVADVVAMVDDALAAAGSAPSA